MKNIQNWENFNEGRREKMAKTGNRKPETKEDRKLQTRDEIIKLLNNRKDISVEEDGANDLKISLEDKHIIQVMIRDKKITIKNKTIEDENKNEFNYDEWGKIKKELSNIIASEKLAQKKAAEEKAAEEKASAETLAKKKR